MRTRNLALAVAAATFLLAGWAAAQSIDDIQYYDPLTGAPASPYDQTVQTVSGTIYVLKGTYNTGTHYIQDDTGSGINFFASDAPPLTYGAQVEITGLVTTYSGEIEIDSPTITVLGSGPEVVPTEVAISDLVNPYDYETVGTRRAAAAASISSPAWTRSSCTSTPTRESPWAPSPTVTSTRSSAPA
jgi:hypothetical protein